MASTGAPPRPGQGTSITPDNASGQGVLMLTTRPGDATHFPKKGDTCRVHYVGYLSNGQKFDSSRDRNQAFTFVLGAGAVIRGIDEAVKIMSRNQMVVLTIPPIYGYGVNGYPPIVPANETITVEVELVSFSEFQKVGLTPEAIAIKDKDKANHERFAKGD